MKRSHALVGMTAAAAAAAAVAVGPAATAGTVEAPPVATGLGGPLQLTFDAKDRPVFSQGFGPGLVSRVNRNGNVVTVVEDSSGSISGVALRGERVAYTLAEGGMVARQRSAAAVQRGEIGTSQFLKLQTATGRQKVLADLGRAEDRRNPDAHQVYGWTGYLQQCGEPAPYPHAPRAGIKESNPHAVAAAPGGGWYVADAAANTIWKVKRGRIRVVSVLKPRSLTITEDIAEAGELPDCAVGTRYNFEPVPTDIEVGRDGRLFVSLLPGEGNVGEEVRTLERAAAEEEVPALGAVVRVNPRNGRARTIATGFHGATNLALAPRRIFVSELEGNRISQIRLRTGNVRPVVGLAMPSTVGFNRGTLWSTYDLFDTEPPGGAALARIDLDGPYVPYEPSMPPV